MIKLDNHRQLKPNEIIRKGDFYTNKMGEVYPANWSIGKTPSRFGEYTFWRRKHTKKPATVTVATPATTKQTEPVTIVEFDYNQTSRLVQVIKLTDEHLKGLEITEGRDHKRKYQFKSFLRSRIYSGPVLAHYGPIADFKG
jgi:hypothetical protein